MATTAESDASPSLEIDAPFSLEPLIAQAESIHHAKTARTDFSPLAHLRLPIPSLPTTISPSPQPQATRSLFLALPTELQILVATHLPWPAQYALKRTCRHLHSLPDLPAPADFFHQRHRGKGYQQSLLVSLCAAGVVGRGFEPCYVCRRFRWKTSFKIAQYERGFLWCDGEGNGGEEAGDVGLGMLSVGAEEKAEEWTGDGMKEDVFENGKFCIDCGTGAGKYGVGESIEVVQEWSDYHSDRQRVIVEKPIVR